jgi:dienelactone hydrolase
MPALRISRTIWLLCSILLLVACTRNQAPSSQNTAQPDGGVFRSPVSTPDMAVATTIEGARVDLLTSDGINLAATFWTPPDQKSVPGVILIHILGGKRQDWTPLARTLQANGYAVLAFDLRGHGESGGKQTYSAMTKDVAVVYAWLQQQETVAPADIVLIGGSIGANIALNFAVNEPDVRGVVLLSPGLDYHGVRTEDAVKRYGSRPILIVASEEDKYAASSALRLDALAAGAHQLQMYKGAGHGTGIIYAGVGLDMLLLDWLPKTLAQQ